MYVGIGYDSHPFDPDVELVLGGVRIPEEPGLRGHSDGDAVAHAIIDAILGAAGLGSIGALFPDDDPAWAGADSLDLLARAVDRVRAHGLRVVNVDVTVVAERPRIRPHAGEMTRLLADRLRVPPGCVGIKGKSNEGMGWIGRGEGLAALAVASLAPEAVGATAAAGAAPGAPGGARPDSPAGAGPDAPRGIGPG